MAQKRKTFFEKIMSGDFFSFGARDAVQAGELVSGFAPGAIGQFASVPFTAAGEAMDFNQRIQDLQQDTGASYASLQWHAHYNDALRQDFQSKNEKIFNSAASATGGAAGAVAGMSLAPIALGTMMATPAGWAVGAASIGGMILGGMGGGMFTNYLLQTERQSVLDIVENIEAKKQQGIPVTAEEVFAVFASGVGYNQGGREIRKALIAEAKTGIFKKAVQTEEGLAAISRIMQNSYIAEKVAMQAVGPLYMQNLMQTGDASSAARIVMQQYADDINRGMPAGYLLVNSQNIDIYHMMNSQQPGQYVNTGMQSPLVNASMAEPTMLPSPQRPGGIIQQ